MTTADPRLRLVQTFACLLAGGHSFPASEVGAAIGLAQWATVSLKSYRLCRRRELDFAYGLDAERYAHLGESATMDLHARVYLDLALQFRKSECYGRSYSDFLAIQPQGAYEPQSLPPSDVLFAMRAELWRIHEALVDGEPLQARSGGGSIERAPEDLLAALAAFTPDRSSVKAAWKPSRVASLDLLSTSDTQVALVDVEATTIADGSQNESVAHMTPLHVALGRPTANLTKTDEVAGPFSVVMYPSLLTSLEYFSPTAVEEKGALGWWATVHAAETWACSHYAELLTHRNDTRQPLQGRHVARWDLAQPAPALDKSGQAKLVAGSSHGAAFALCLMQAIARAHTSRDA